MPETSKTLISANQGIADQALFAGMGIGFHPEIYAQKRADLVEVLAPQPDWVVPLWLVTHTDLHRSAKVQALLKFIKNDRSSNCDMRLAIFQFQQGRARDEPDHGAFVFILKPLKRR